VSRPDRLKPVSASMNAVRASRVRRCGPSRTRPPDGSTSGASRSLRPHASAPRRSSSSGAQVPDRNAAARSRARTCFVGMRRSAGCPNQSREARPVMRTAHCRSRGRPVVSEPLPRGNPEEAGPAAGGQQPVPSWDTPPRPSWWVEPLRLSKANRHRPESEAGRAQIVEDNRRTRSASPGSGSASGPASGKTGRLPGELVQNQAPLLVDCARHAIILSPSSGGFAGSPRQHRHGGVAPIAPSLSARYRVTSRRLTRSGVPAARWNGRGDQRAQVLRQGTRVQQPVAHELQQPAEFQVRQLGRFATSGSSRSSTGSMGPVGPARSAGSRPTGL